MHNTSLLSEAIRYQKLASNQIFQLMTLCQSNSEDLLQKTLDQCAWLPESSRESCLDWSTSCRETIKYLQDLAEKGFEQLEQVFVPPAIKKEIGEIQSQPKQQAAAPSQRTATRKKKSPTPMRRVKTQPAKASQKEVVAKDQAVKATPSKSEPPVQISQAPPPKPGTAAEPGPKSVAVNNVTAQSASPQPTPSENKAMVSTAAGGDKTPSTPPAPAS